MPLWRGTRARNRRRPAVSGRDEPGSFSSWFLAGIVTALVERYGQRAAAKQPSLKNVTPHVGHTTACHLLKAGVDLNTIRAWLGHVSLDTTNIYAEIDVEMKSKALAKCEISGDGNKKGWRDDADLMIFLKSP
jgi:integrase/recombinase XerD